uniref:Uncharacterized protein n=1 Tax=viral metagenome TaxID=1070528 RepID=A0A6H1ZRF6_9ZZZZ
MSGGHFEYGQWQISEIADEIEKLIRNNDSTEKDKYGGHYSPEVIIKFKDAVQLLRRAYIYAQRIDWLVSGDDGEESFIERLKEDLDELE